MHFFQWVNRTLSSPFSTRSRFYTPYDIEKLGIGYLTLKRIMMWVRIRIRINWNLSCVFVRRISINCILYLDKWVLSRLRQTKTATITTKTIATKATEAIATPIGWRNDYIWLASILTIITNSENWVTCLIRLIRLLEGCWLNMKNTQP